MVSLHTPIMVKEILEFFQESFTDDQKPLRYFDGTLGRGGHLDAIYKAFPNLEVVGFDRDLAALQFCEERFASEVSRKRFCFYQKNFTDFSTAVDGEFDLALLDLGVSSPQLDEGARGFSFMREGPLDMRMNANDERTARDLIMECDEEDLLKIFTEYGEIRKPQRVIRAILHDRATKEFNSTLDLANMIARIEGWRKTGHHPATQYFQALRICVNDELRPLGDAVANIVHGLRPKGRLAVLTFHSLEDRIVKHRFKELGEKSLGSVLTKKVVKTSWDETKDNTRARSAKLRVFERLSDESPRPVHFSKYKSKDQKKREDPDS